MQIQEEEPPGGFIYTGLLPCSLLLEAQGGGSLNKKQLLRQHDLCFEQSPRQSKQTPNLSGGEEVPSCPMLTGASLYSKWERRGGGGGGWGSNTSKGGSKKKEVGVTKRGGGSGISKPLQAFRGIHDSGW